MQLFRLLYLLIFAFSTFSAVSQNIVPNASFEDTLCTLPGSYYSSANYWVNPTGTSPDYYNFSFITSNCNISNSTVFGNQVPHNGSGFFGMAVFQQIANRREYIGVELQDSMISAHDYCISYYVSLAARCNVAARNIDMAITNDSIYDITKFDTIPIVPQIVNNNGIIVDTLNWTLISRTYTALGGERFISIGNFNGDLATDTLNLNYGDIIGSYYYIDDVSIEDCTVGLSNNPATQQLIIFPNPSNGTFKVKNVLPTGHTHFELYDLSGSLIRRIQLIDNYEEEFIELVGLHSGVYFGKIVNESAVIARGKMCIINTP